MAIKQSFTAVVERNVQWSGAFSTEPYEAAWASETIFFVRALAVEGNAHEGKARVQISPDGMHWCDEGTTFPLPSHTNAVTFGRVSHFGGWLRIVGGLPDGVTLTVIVYLSLKE